jgi:uncharacterized protein (DUF849 family)
MERPPVIIEAAINGLTPRTTNPHVPKTADEIATDALACFRAGAAIVHNHGAVFGDPDAVMAEYLAAWRPVLADRPDALLYPTANVVDGSFDLRHLELLAASGQMRLTFCDPGSLNLGAVDADGVPIGSFIHTNSFDSIAAQMELATRDRVGPSLAIYEPGFLRCVLAWWRAGRLPQGSMIKLYLSTEQGYMGAPFGLPPTPAALDMYLDLLGDCPIPWAVSVVGGDVVRSGLAEHAVRHGGHIHLGLEFHAGDRTPTNVELITEAVQLCDRLGMRVATPDEAAQLLDLPRR